MKPPDLRVLNGGKGATRPDSRRSKQRAAAVKSGPVERPVGAPPKGEPAEVAARWRELRRQNPHFTIRDRHCLLEYCRAWVDYEAARAEVAEHGAMGREVWVRRSDGEVFDVAVDGESAWARRAERIAKRLDALRKDLALTPITRARAPTPGEAKRGDGSLYDE